MDILSYPFDVKLLNRKKKAVKRELLEKQGLVEIVYDILKENA